MNILLIITDIGVIFKIYVVSTFMYSSTLCEVKKVWWTMFVNGKLLSIKTQYVDRNYLIYDLFVCLLI